MEYIHSSWGSALPNPNFGYDFGTFEASAELLENFGSVYFLWTNIKFDLDLPGWFGKRLHIKVEKHCGEELNPAD